LFLTNIFCLSLVFLWKPRPYPSGAAYGVSSLSPVLDKKEMFILQKQSSLLWLDASDRENGFIQLAPLFDNQWSLK
jgi:hypothetical protein